jgi:hypothetical protein
MSTMQANENEFNVRVSREELDLIVTALAEYAERSRTRGNVAKLAVVSAIEDRLMGLEGWTRRQS